MKPEDSREFDLHPVDQRRLATLCGQFDDNLKLVEKRLQVRIGRRGHHFRIVGGSDQVAAAAEVIRHLYRETEASDHIPPETVHLFIRETGQERLPEDLLGDEAAVTVVKTPKLSIRPRGRNQQKYVHNIRSHDINFGIGPAGTGKTWLAVACAVEALREEQVRRILLVRPAVEAGEKLGFLPGDLAQKVDPYLRPLYDALYEMLGFDQVTRLIEKNVIEIAPLAFMRGRTLNNAFIILDESQNTTREQMKMFLTRIGFGSTAVITGDTTQVDLPRGQHSGLIHAASVLGKVPGIGFTRFDARDVVRHPLVQRIVEAYDTFDEGGSPASWSSLLTVDIQNVYEGEGVPDSDSFRRWASAAWLQDAPSEVTIRIVGALESQTLNHQYRGKDRPTNVLSFPFEAPAGIRVPLAGDLVICAPVVEREAREQNKSPEAHWAHMVVHGMLHLQGYDHMNDSDAGVMEGLEIRLLQQLGYANPYEAEEPEPD